MATLSLSLAVGAYDHVRDLQPRGISLNQSTLRIEEIFFRFTKFREWDAADMSFGKVVALMADPDPAIIAIPVFVSRVFRHSAIYVRKGSGITKPKDLEGKRVGVPEWAQTATIYVRGMLAHEYGVDLRSIKWTQAGVNDAGRVEKVKLHLPRGLSVTPAPQRSLADMLAKGDLDAVISARDPGGERMFPDYPADEAAYFRKTRIFPIMHVVALRRDVYERDRWVAMNLLQAFEDSKNQSLARAVEIGASATPVAWLADHTRRWREMAGEDFWPYGIEPNRPTLEAFLQYSFEQGVCARHLKPEELFAPETRERAKI